MAENKYMVCDTDEIILASDMTWEMAMTFLRGFKETYYNERLMLIIMEMPRSEAADKEVIK